MKSLVIAALFLSACASGPFYDPVNHYYAVASRYNARAYGYGQRAPVPSPYVGTLYQPPMGWSGQSEGRSIRIENRMDLPARCWVDGRAVLPAVPGTVVQGAVVTTTGVRVVPLIPPMGETHHIVNAWGRRPLVRCEVYEGPPPFQLVRAGQKRVREVFRIDTWNTNRSRGRVAD